MSIDSLVVCSRSIVSVQREPVAIQGHARAAAHPFGDLIRRASGLAPQLIGTIVDSTGDSALPSGAASVTNGPTAGRSRSFPVADGSDLQLLTSPTIPAVPDGGDLMGIMNRRESASDVPHIVARFRVRLTAGSFLRKGV